MLMEQTHYKNAESVCVRKSNKCQLNNIGYSRISQFFADTYKAYHKIHKSLCTSCMQLYTDSSIQVSSYNTRARISLQYDNHTQILSYKTHKIDQSKTISNYCYHAQFTGGTNLIKNNLSWQSRSSFGQTDTQHHMVKNHYSFHMKYLHMYSQLDKTDMITPINDMTNHIYLM